MLDERVVDVEGSAEQRGFTQGISFSGVQHKGWQSLAGLELAPPWLPAPLHQAAIRALLSGLGRFYLHHHRQVLAERAGGRHLRYLRGLAQGLGAPPWVPYGFNALEIESCNLGFAMGCTSLALGGNSTRSGAPRLGYNHDFPPSFGPLLFVRRSRPDRGFRSLAVSYPVLGGAIVGVNEHGLAMSVNQAFATDLSRARPSLYVSLLVQECLDECPDVERAIARFAATPVTNGALVTLIDETGARAVVELSGTRARVRRPVGAEVLWSCNKYRVNEMARHEVPVGAVTTGLLAGYDVHECNLTRHRRLPVLLADGGPYADEDLQRILADHDGGAGDTNTICRHEDPRNQTIMSVIVDPAARTMKVLFGKPCEQVYQQVGLFDEAPPLRRAS